MSAADKSQLVMVHGIGGPRDSVLERDTWLRALAVGARDAGHADAVSGLTRGWLADTRFVDYSDLFTVPGEQGLAGVVDDAEVVFLHALVTELTDELLHQAQERDDRRAERVILDARAQLGDDSRAAQGMGEPVRVVARILTSLLQLPGLRLAGQWASGSPLLGHLAQVGRYLDRTANLVGGDSLNARIRRRVLESVDSRRPVVVVAHSLGSVVAFEALHHLDRDVRLLVTLGSPLAMAGVVWQRLQPRPPRTPGCVERWLNFWDRDDIVACRPRIENWMLPSSAGVRPLSHRVDSDGVWVHTAAKYLSRPAVAGPIVEALKR